MAGMEGTTVTAKSVVVTQLILALAVVSGLQGQDPESPQAASQSYNELIDAMVEHTSGIEFTERDIESVLSLWGDLEAIGLEDEEDDEEMLDIEEILADQKYRCWAASHGLDAEDWFRKSMRIQLMMMREEMHTSAGMMENQMAQQEAMIEAQCAQVSEEMCRQMRQGLEAMAAFGKAWERIPPPTSSEAALLEKYQEQLMGLMNSDEEELEDW